ncbi:MAG: hypothetical protein U0271_36380 [Polyangiaceae bacterium]
MAADEPTAEGVSAPPKPAVRLEANVIAALAWRVVATVFVLGNLVRLVAVPEVGPLSLALALAALIGFAYLIWRASVVGVVTAGDDLLRLETLFGSKNLRFDEVKTAAVERVSSRGRSRTVIKIVAANSRRFECDVSKLQSSECQALVDRIHAGQRQTSPTIPTEMPAWFERGDRSVAEWRVNLAVLPAQDYRTAVSEAELVAALRASGVSPQHRLAAALALSSSERQDLRDLVRSVGRATAEPALREALLAIGSSHEEARVSAVVPRAQTALTRARIGVRRAAEPRSQESSAAPPSEARREADAEAEAVAEASTRDELEATAPQRPSTPPTRL